MVLALFYLLATMPGTPTNDDADTLVICPPDFQATLKPWLEYRETQGYKIVVQAPSSTSAGLNAQIKHVAKSGNLKNVVLIGDAADARSNPNRLVPTAYVDAKVNVKFGSEPEIATDHTYADLNGDGIVDLNIGRIPVDSVDELVAYTKRVFEYEAKQQTGNWQRRINFVAGVGGFGQMLDKMIEQSVKKIVTDLVPSEYDVTMTYGSWRSPYCPDPRRFSQTTIDRFNEGCLFWIYIGHGNRRRLDRLKLPDRQFNILDNNSVSKIASQNGMPIAIFLSCYTAATDDHHDGLAETMIKQNNGPIGIISSSRVSMPYAMSIFSLEMLDGYFNGDAQTLGELVKQSKQKLVSFKQDKSEYHQLIHSMGTAFSPEPGLLKDERVEHVHLMHLLGDPLLKLNRPEAIELTVPKNISAGETIEVSGRVKQPGELTVDLAYRRDRFKNRPPRRREYLPTDESFTNYQTVYEQSQDLICERITTSVQAGAFSVQLSVPEDCSGACHVRTSLFGTKYLAFGSKNVDVKRD